MKENLHRNSLQKIQRLRSARGTIWFGRRGNLGSAPRNDYERGVYEQIMGKKHPGSGVFPPQPSSERVHKETLELEKEYEEGLEKAFLKLLNNDPLEK